MTLPLTPVTPGSLTVSGTASGSLTATGGPVGSLSLADVASFGLTPGASIQAAINTLGLTGGTITIPAGRWTLEQIPLIPAGITGRLWIRGVARDATTLVLSPQALRAFDMNRTADYQTFQNFEISDLTVDCANLLGSSHNHVVVGNLAAGGWGQRSSFASVAVRRVATVNVPVSDTQNRHSVSFASSHLASGETQTTITGILVEDCDFEGGVGVSIMGTGTYTAGLGVNVFLDDIHLNRVRHDTLVTPTGSNTIQANFQIGGVGYGGTVRMRDCYGARSSDVGVEIDAVQDFVGEGCSIVDSWNDKYLVGNFRPPMDVRGQRNTWRDCRCRNNSLDRASRASTDFAIFGSPGNANAVTFGELVVDNFVSDDSVSTAPFAGHNQFEATTVDFRKVTFRGRASYSALAVTTGGNVFTGIQFRNTVNPSAADIDVTFAFAGTRTGTGTNTWVLCNPAGTDLSLRARVAVDRAGYTGLSTTTDTFYYIEPAGVGASTIKCESLTPICLRTLGASQGKDEGVAFGASFTAKGRAYVENMDMEKAVAGSGFDVDTSVMAAAQIPNIVIRRILSQRTAASGSGPVTAPVAMTGLVSGTGAAVGATSKGVPCVVQFAQGSGSGVTAIDVSTNAGATYTNLLTQSAGALPSGPDIVVGPLSPDALVKATFSTTQPTITLIPVAP